MSERPSGWRWLAEKIVVPIMVPIIVLAGGYLVYIRENPQKAAIQNPSMDMAAEAGRTMTGSWTTPGVDCRFAVSISVDQDALIISNSDPEQSLIGRFKFRNWRGNRIDTDDNGIVTEFWRDDDDLLYQRAGREQRFVRCD